MRLSATDSEQALREEVRDFLARNRPASGTEPDDFDARVAFLRGWQATLAGARLVGLCWPSAYGGRGAPLTDQIVVGEELARSGAPMIIGSVGLDVVGPSLIDHGTEEQKERFLARILSADDLWCQGFSEVGAGSDLAALRTRAVDRGDHFVLSGHKVWTSLAHHAQWCAVLARTDPDSSGHRGISYLLVAMDSPGIEVRPLVQVTGDPEFGEVHFEDVVVPRDGLLGELHGGWRIAMQTLAHERGGYGVGRHVILRVLLDRIIDHARTHLRDGRPAIEHPGIRAALARAHIALEVLRQQGYRSVAKMIADGHPGFESSVDKLVLADAEQLVGAAGLDVLGADAALRIGPFQHAYLYGRAASVYGGSAQIQRTIIAERILGLPRSH